MIKTSFILTLIIQLSSVLNAQDMKTFKLYKPEENAAKALSAAVSQAKSSGKNVLVQIGGNWCVWCARFEKFITEDKTIDSIISKDYVVYHLNYSQENKNQSVLTKLGYPQRFGFPVFVVLDQKGNRIHTQNSAYLEKDEGYHKGNVIDFLVNWSPAALEASRYKDF